MHKCSTLFIKLNVFDKQILSFHLSSATFPSLNAEMNVHDISICEKEKKEDR